MSCPKMLHFAEHIFSADEWHSTKFAGLIFAMLKIQ